MNFAVYMDTKPGVNDVGVHMKGIYGLFAVFLLHGTAWASSANGQDDSKWESWPTVGKASLSWFIFNIYQSELKSPSGEYRQSEDVSPHPMALSILYQRDVTKEELIQVTREQWSNLGYSDSQQNQWVKALDDVYNNVYRGERMVYITDGTTGEFRFFSKDSGASKLGEVTDERLNDAFLSIWLSPRSSYPDHRARLIGVKH